MPSKKGKLFVISGPSGVGKGTIVKALCPQYAQVSVSATTRPQGKGEVDGTNYYFLTRQEFERRISEGLFLEHAEVFGNLYGTPAKEIKRELEAGRNIILEIDVQGALQVKSKMPEAVMIFILPPSMEELERRIRARGRDTEEVIAERLEKAALEMKIGKEHYDYFVVNDILENAVRETAEIIDSNN
ncbi:MAG: guanylate kinase [Phycisphaerae bacterium]|jgi:guanylate kinase